MPELVTVPNVHLASVGTWECSTGTWECSAEDIAAIVQAQDDPGIRTPVVKLGHVDPRFDGEPAVGRIVNMRSSDDGQDLYGDLAGVPAWLAEIMGSAFPDRSVEVRKLYKGSTGHQHQAVLSAVALLGVSVPAIENLDDVRALYDGDYADLVAAADAAGAEAFTTVAAPVIDRGAPDVRASVSVDTIRGEFYENLPEGSWAWIRDIFVGDPGSGAAGFLIVEGTDGDLYQLEYTQDTDGDVTFGSPVRVTVQYVASPDDDESDDTVIRLSRSGTAQQDPRLLPRDPEMPEGGRMEITDLLARLGLPEDASEEQIDARVAEIEAATVAPVETTGPPALPEGVTVIDTETLEGLRVAASRGDEAYTRLTNQDRDQFIESAVRMGRFPPSRRQHYVDAWERDPEGTRELINIMATGAFPTGGTELGHAGSGEDAADEAIWQQISAALGIKEG